MLVLSVVSDDEGQGVRCCLLCQMIKASASVVCVR